MEGVQGRRMSETDLAEHRLRVWISLMQGSVKEPVMVYKTYQQLEWERMVAMAKGVNTGS